MSTTRLCLFLAALAFAVAAFLAFGIVRGGPSIEGLALVGFALWALSGAVAGAVG